MSLDKLPQININIHIHINMNIDIHIIINMNIEYYLKEFVLNSRHPGPRRE